VPPHQFVAINKQNTIGPCRTRCGFIHEAASAYEITSVGWPLSDDAFEFLDRRTPNRIVNAITPALDDANALLIEHLTTSTPKSFDLEVSPER